MPPEIQTPPPAAQTPPSPAAPSVGQSFDESFPNDDGLDSPPEPPPAAQPPKEAAKTPDKPAEPPKGKSEPKQASAEPPEEPEQTPAEPDRPSFTPPQVAKPSELRSWATKVGKWAEKMTSKADKLQAKIAQLESQPPKQAEDVANLVKELAALKKQNEQYEKDLQLTRYERSRDYEQKYHKPYQDAVARAYREVKEMLVTEPDPRNPENQIERAAVESDFDEIYGLGTTQASRVAKAKFGDAAIIVMQHRQRVRELRDAAWNAVEEYKAKGSEVETQNKAQAAQYDAAKERLFHIASESHAKRNPELFLERDGDDEGNELLAKGREFASAVFGGNEGLTLQQIAWRDANAHNRMAAYPRLLRDNKQLKTELAAALKTIEELRSSSPGAPKPSAAKKDESPGAKPWEQAFDELPG